MWEQYTYRKDFQLFSPGSVVSSAQNQSHLQHQVSILPTPRLPLLTRQLMHHPPPFHLHPYQLPHQREAPCKSIHWRCSTRHAHSVALSSTGRANLKVLPTSHAGQSSVLSTTSSEARGKAGIKKWRKRKQLATHSTHWAGELLLSLTLPRVMTRFAAPTVSIVKVPV
jgi:hypothetical protein